LFDASEDLIEFASALMYHIRRDGDSDWHLRRAVVDRQARVSGHCRMLSLTASAAVTFVMPTLCSMSQWDQLFGCQEGVADPIMPNSLKYAVENEAQKTIGANIISATMFVDGDTAAESGSAGDSAIGLSEDGSGGAMISVGVRTAVGIGCPMLLSFSMSTPLVTGEAERFCAWRGSVHSPHRSIIFLDDEYQVARRLPDHAIQACPTGTARKIGVFLSATNEDF
jgi:hypothetical protein